MGTTRKHRAALADGGYKGWIAVICAMCTWYAWAGSLKGLSLMLPHLRQQLDTQTWLVGWMVAIMDCVIDLVGPFASPLEKRLGARPVVFACGFCLGFAFIAAAFTSDLALTTFLLAGIAGPAIGISNVVTRELIAQRFTKTYALAVGVATAGGSLAFVTYPLLVQLFLNTYGWRGTMMLLGAILSHLGVMGLLLRTTPESHADNGRGQYTSMPVEKNDQSLCASLKDSFKLDMLKSPSYWLVCSVATITTTVMTSWVIFFTTQTNEAKGFPLSDVSAFVSAFGIAKIVGNICCGVMCKRHPVLCIACMTIAVVITSACYLLDPWLVSYWSIMAYVVVYGLAHSVLYTLQDVIIRNAIGLERLGCAFGWIAMTSGIFRGLVTFYPGIIFDELGSFFWAYVLMAVINALAVPPLIGLAWMQSGKRSPRNLNRNE